VRATAASGSSGSNGCSSTLTRRWVLAQAKIRVALNPAPEREKDECVPCCHSDRALFLCGSIEPARLVFDKLQRKGDLRQANTTTALLLDKYTIT
jgi:hypothetical protein